MKVYFYTIEIQGSNESVKQLLEKIMELPLEEREKKIRNKSVFLEYIEFGSNGFVYIDFTGRRLKHGPGLSEKGNETKDFEFQFNENVGFGEQVAAVYSLNSNLIAVQYHQPGPRAEAIEEYFSSFLMPLNNKDKQIIFEPFISYDTLEKLQKSERILAIDVAVDVSNLDDMDKNNLQLTESVGFCGIKDLVERTEKFTVQFKISSKPGFFLNSEEAKQHVKSIFRRSTKVKKLKVSLKETLDDKTTILDFFNARVVKEIPVNKLDMTPGLRWTRDSRMREIEKVLEMLIEERT